MDATDCVTDTADSVCRTCRTVQMTNPHDYDCITDTADYVCRTCRNVTVTNPHDYDCITDTADCVQDMQNCHSDKPTWLWLYNGHCWLCAGHVELSTDTTDCVCRTCRLVTVTNSHDCDCIADTADCVCRTCRLVNRHNWLCMQDM